MSTHDANMNRSNANEAPPVDVTRLRPQDAAPPVPSSEDNREHLAHFLIFVGRLVAIAGGLAMIRLWTFDWFYAALIPIGIGMTIAGARIRRRIAPNEPSA